MEYIKIIKLYFLLLCFLVLIKTIMSFEFLYEYTFEILAASLPISGLLIMNNGFFGFYYNKSLFMLT